jgi:hypothetical protein
MLWITRAHPRIDRIACTWLIRRFIDEHAEFNFVSADRVVAEARRLGAVPFGVPGVQRRSDARSSFDALREEYRLDDTTLDLLAAIVEAADGGRTEHAPQSAGLLAICHGLAQRCASDAELLRQGLVVYDALYDWCHKAPPGPEFALPRLDPGPAIGWRQAMRARRSRMRAARALAALNDATLRTRALERICGDWGPVETADVHAAASRAAATLPSTPRLRTTARAVVATIVRLGTSIGRARRRRCLAQLDDALLHGTAVRFERPKLESR